MPDDTPLISLVLVNRGAGAIIQEAIESVQRQTYRHFELIIIDCDQDKPLSLMQLQFCAKDSRIQIYPLPAGVNPFNFGVSKTRGDFISVIGAEDLWPDQKLEWQLAALNASGASVALGHAQRFSTDADGETYWGQVSEVRLSPTHYLAQVLRVQPAHMINFHTALIRKSALAGRALVDPELDWGADWDAWLRLAARVKFVHVDKVLLFCREYPRARIAPAERSLRARTELRIIERHCPRGLAGWHLRSDAKRNRYEACLQALLSDRALPEARALLFQAMRDSAFIWRTSSWALALRILRASL